MNEYIQSEGENILGMLHMEIDQFKYCYTSTSTLQRRFRADREGIWHSFTLPILGFLPSKCVVRVYFVESAMVMEVSRTEWGEL